MKHLKTFEYWGSDYQEDMDPNQDDFDLNPDYETEEEEGQEDSDMPDTFRDEEDFVYGIPMMDQDEEEEGEEEFMGDDIDMDRSSQSPAKISSFNNFKKQESSCPSCNCLQCECGGGANESKKAKPDFLDLDKDGNKKETMKKAAADKKKGGKEDKKEDKKAPAKKGGLSKSQEKLPEGLKKAIKAGVRD
jgi:hypothetical protein